MSEQLRTALQSLGNFTEHRFEQLMRYEDGRTPLYLTEEQYNAIRELVAQATAAPALSADDQVSALRRNCLENIAQPVAPYVDPRNGADTWSANGEDWHNIGTIAELIRESQSDLELLAEGDVVFVGKIRYQDPASFVDRDAVLTCMNENAGASDAGEWVDGYPNSSQAADQELTDLLEAWARKNCRPDFYLVDNSREYTITAADMEEALGAEVANDE